MSTYVPMTRMTRVPVVDFHKVAPHGDPEVLGAGCPNPKGILGSDVQISGFGNSSVSPITCRAEQNGYMVLCDTCNEKYQQAKEVMGDWGFGDEFTYFSGKTADFVETKSFKDRAIGWAKEHPVLAVAGTVVAAAAVIGVVAGGYLSRSFNGAADTSKGDANLSIDGDSNVTTTKAPEIAVATVKKPEVNSTNVPVVVEPEANSTTATAKPATTVQTTVPTTQAKPETTLSEKQAKLNLELNIYNAQNVQDLNVKTTQTFKNGTLKEAMHIVPKFGGTRLVFDINARHHKNVEVSYTNNFKPKLRDRSHLNREVPHTYGFDVSLLARDSGKFSYDKNGDGKINAAHTLYVDNGHYVLNREFEDANGKITPPVTTKPMILFVKSESTDPINLKIGVQRAGKWVDTRRTLDYGQYTSFAVSPGTRRVTSAIDRNEIASYWASNLLESTDGNMCLLLNDASIAKKLPLTEGNCGIVPTKPPTTTTTTTTTATTTTTKAPTSPPKVNVKFEYALRNKQLTTNASFQYWIYDKNGNELVNTEGKCYSIRAHTVCKLSNSFDIYPSELPLSAKVTGWSDHNPFHNIEFNLDRAGLHGNCYHIWTSHAGTEMHYDRQAYTADNC